jgi:hypothetical protein
VRVRFKTTVSARVKITVGVKAAVTIRVRVRVRGYSCLQNFISLLILSIPG